MENRERIRTRESRRDIQTLDRAAEIARSLKRNAIRTKERIGDLTDYGVITPEEYAGETLRDAAESAVSVAERQAGKTADAVHGRIRGKGCVRNTDDADQSANSRRQRPSRHPEERGESAGDVSEETRRE